MMLSTLCLADGVFSDISTDAWYKDSVKYAKENGLMNGVSKTEFAPEINITRSMAVTVLYRMAKSPECAFEKTFADVSKEDYYGIAVLWAVREKIATGYGNMVFGSNDEITREQFATMIYRYVKSTGKDVSSKMALTKFEDASKVSAYATDALEWACEVGLINGMTETTLAPQGKTTRAQAATVFMRLDKLLKESQKPDPKPVNPTTPDSDNNPAITLKAISDFEKKEVKAVISLENNKGIASLKAFIEYDTNVLTLKEVSFNKAFGEYVSAPQPYSSPQVLNFISPLEDVIHNGEFATLIFTINEDFDTKTEIKVVYDKDNTFNSNFEFIDFMVLNDKVIINKNI